LPALEAPPPYSANIENLVEIAKKCYPIPDGNQKPKQRRPYRCPKIKAKTKAW
jgi:hypothetical protein